MPIMLVEENCRNVPSPAPFIEENLSASASEAPRGIPVVLEPILVERVWGTYDLGAWHTPSNVERPVGEIWLTAEECSAAGMGASLQALTAAQPSAFGDLDGAGFPLLIKLLFARERLSVQVHPNDAHAQADAQPRGKTECWYVLSAEAEAEVAVGLREPLSPGQLREAIRAGSIEAKLRMLPVRAGDLVFVEAGTIHAIGAGVVILEIQQYCDTTYRLWDYGRPRELHLDAGLAVVRDGLPSGLVTAVRKAGFDRLVSSPHFTVDRFRLDAGATSPLGENTSMQILVATRPGAALHSLSGSMDLPLGQAVVLPGGGSPASLHAVDVMEVIRVLPGPGAC